MQGGYKMSSQLTQRKRSAVTKKQVYSTQSHVSNKSKSNDPPRRVNKEKPLTRINEYYCQMTNNINISVDIDK